jgi:hypothetical protein
MVMFETITHLVNQKGNVLTYTAIALSNSAPASFHSLHGKVGLTLPKSTAAGAEAEQ